MSARDDDMAWVPGATFRMGSDAHYPEEAPAHVVTVDGFWIDRRQITNRRFARFVRERGYVTVAERPLDPAAFPDAPAENLVPGSLVFTRTRGPVDLRHLNCGGPGLPVPAGVIPRGPGRCWRTTRPSGRARRLRRRVRLLRVGGQGPAD